MQVFIHLISCQNIFIEDDTNVLITCTPLLSISASSLSLRRFSRRWHVLVLLRKFCNYLMTIDVLLPLISKKGLQIFQGKIILVWSVEIAKICVAISPSAILYFLLELSRQHRIQYFSISITGVATRGGR